MNKVEHMTSTIFDLPVEVQYLIVWWCKSDYKAISNLLLLLPYLRDYIKKYKRCRKELKKGVLIFKIVDKRGSKKEYFVLPNKKREGEYKKWSLGHILRIKSNYKNGLLHGEHKMWHLWSDQLYSLSTYKYGKLHGECKSWWRSGKIRKICTYKNGLLDGESKEWTDEFVRGQERSQKHKLLFHSHYKDGLLHGEQKRWHNSTYRMCTLFNCVRGQLHGEYKEWYSNGRIMSISHFQYGMRCGTITEWCRNGNLTVCAEYADYYGSTNSPVNIKNYKCDCCHNKLYLN